MQGLNLLLLHLSRWQVGSLALAQLGGPLSRFIPKDSIFVVAVVNRIVSLISLSDFSLLVCRNARDFSVVSFISYEFTKFIN